MCEQFTFSLIVFYCDEEMSLPANELDSKKKLQEEEEEREEEEEEDVPQELLGDAHRRYLDGLSQHLIKQLQGFEPQRLLVLYFSVAGSDALGAPWLSDRMRCGAIADELRACFCLTTGGFAATPLSATTTVTITMTHCALFILKLIDRLDVVAAHVARIREYIRKCQRVDDGCFWSFAGGGGEIDVRMCYSAVMSAAVLSTIDPDAQDGTVARYLADVVGVDVEKLISFLAACQTYEGGFGGTPGCEAHGGMTYCAVSSLSILGAVGRVRRSDAVRYCCRRVASFEPTHCGATGFQGRPNKPCDTCYTFWVGATLAQLDALDLVDVEAIRNFVFACQAHSGGVAKHEAMFPDPMHTCLALKGLACLESVAATSRGSDAMKVLDPVLGCTAERARQWNIKFQSFKK